MDDVLIQVGLVVESEVPNAIASTTKARKTSFSC